MRLAFVLSHPIQYYSHWFRHVSGSGGVEAFRVFYLWDFGVRKTQDPGFGREIIWDVPLLEGYESEMVPNLSRRPGTDHFNGLHNPELMDRLCAFGPDAVAVLGYWSRSHLGLLRGKQRLGCPLLLRGDSHDLVPPGGWKGRVAKTLASALFRAFRGYLYCGEANRRYFRERGAHEGSLFYCPYSVDSNLFNPAVCCPEEAASWKSKRGIPPGYRLVLFAGKFEEKKRPLDLLQAFERVAPAQTALLFVGNGELEIEMKRRAAESPNVHFLPFQNQTEMARVYAVSDLFVLPSMGRFETWGLAVQEALACGTPVLVSDHVGCHEDLVGHGKSGAVFEAGSVESLARALEEGLGEGQLEAWAAQAPSSVQGHTAHKATAGLLEAARAAVGSLP